LAAVACCGVARALHASLAYSSTKALSPLPVKQVRIDSKNPEDDPTGWYDEIRRRAARCGVGYRDGSATVVFASELPQKMAVLRGDDGIDAPPQAVMLKPGDDWPVYKRLLQEDLFQHLRGKNVGVEKSSSGLHLSFINENLPVSQPPCVVKRGVDVTLTRIEMDGEDHLLISLGVKHRIEATESIYAMLKREPSKSLLKQNLKVKTRPGIYPSYSGTLCEPKTRGTISAPRAGLPNNQSLIEYSNSKNDRRNMYLKTEFDPDAPAVVLKTLNRDGRDVIIDYPPQQLEPAYYNGLPPSALAYMRLSPGEWVEKTTSIQELLSDWRPNFATMTSDAVEPFLDSKVLWEERDFPIGMLDCAKSMTERSFLRDGPELRTTRNAELLPVYLAKYADKVEQLVEDLTPYFQKWTPSISVAPRDKAATASLMLSSSMT